MNMFSGMKGEGLATEPATLKEYDVRRKWAEGQVLYNYMTARNAMSDEEGQALLRGAERRSPKSIAAQAPVEERLRAAERIGDWDNSQ